ncbi:hypothetical protein [Vibrio diabolicus]|uniref:hypothetical protein n=1 Tax=Vibrio diabolicus TaxID=50719 RepID=UPI00215F84CD|nr:hypothetical protein [Vibrio diabolicus]MCS0443116.1 hypothetical protein [Vibrio diabolicus]
MSNQQKGQQALEQAFEFFTNLVNQDHGFDKELWNEGFFTYLLTKKQMNTLKKLCISEGWTQPINYSITIKGEFIAHILKSRQGKDLITTQEAITILKTAFSPTSLVSINVKYNNQAVVLNSNTKIKIKGNSYYSSAFFEVGEKLENKTAYHAGWNKIQAMIKNGEK